MAIPVRVVVPSHPDDRDILDIHLRAHQVFSPRDIELVVASTLEGNYAKACNEGARGHNGLIVLLNDDTIPGPNWYEDMRANYSKALSEMRPGLIGARVDAISGPQAIMSGVPLNQLTPCKRIVTAAAVVHSEEFWNVGGFDEDFPFWYSDDSLSARLTQAGCINLIGNWYMRHFGSVGSQRRGLDYQSHDEEYGPLFQERYGGWES